MDYRQIVWLASYPKSGNTWVRCFLDAYFLGEVKINELVTSVSDDSARRSQLCDGSNVKDMPTDVQGLTRGVNLLRLIHAYHDSNIPGIPLFVKTHQAHIIANGLELLPEMLTKATICIVRDPRDVLPSFAKHMGKTLDEAVEAMTDAYRVLDSPEGNRVADVVSSWSKNVTSYINADSHNVKYFKYEAMLARPEEAFIEMLEHAGVKPDPARVKAALDIVSLANLQKQEKEHGFKESSTFAKNEFFGAKKEKPTLKHINTIERKFSKLMKQLGYLDKRRVAA